MTERAVEVFAYSGYRDEESPRSFVLDGRRIAVRKVLEQWVEEDVVTRVKRRCFRVKGDDFRKHILRCQEVDGVWLHEGGADNG
jgi:hypothetical protein